MVIVIIAILAAIALPKFADLSQDARIASLKAARGAVISAMNIVHSQAVIEGKDSLASSSVILEGETIDIAYGYPTFGNTVASSSLVKAAGLDESSFGRLIQTSNGVLTLYLTLALPGNSYTSGCAIGYHEATSSSPASVDSLNSFLMNHYCK